MKVNCKFSKIDTGSLFPPLNQLDDNYTLSIGLINCFSRYLQALGVSISRHVNRTVRFKIIKCKQEVDNQVNTNSVDFCVEVTFGEVKFTFCHFYWNMSDCSLNIPPPCSGYCIKVHTEEQLVVAVESYLTDSDQIKKMFNSLYYIDRGFPIGETP
jgi:hypothetical protein